MSIAGRMVGVLVKTYLGVGNLLAIPLVLSYIWGGITAGCSGLFAFLYTVSISSIVGVFFGFVRVFAWGPSLVSWFNYEPRYSFWHWLAPGLSTSCN